MVQSWVFFWFLAVVVYIIGKMFKNKKLDLTLGDKYFVFSPMVFTNIIAIILGAIATWIMLTTNYNL